jgi:TonB-dependent receptor
MGQRPIFTPRRPIAAAVRLALTGGVLSLALPAVPAAAQSATTPSTASTSAPTRTAATQSGAARPAKPGGGRGSAARGRILLAQTVAPPAAAGGGADAANPVPVLQEVVVSGFRESLAKDIAAKRQAIGFTDSIYSEDIGKFPDANIAEAFNRVPGITITRDNTGQGVDIAIRGLGPDFTKVLLNGAPIAVASTGPTDAQNTNQEVDLNMFPPELFTSLTVQKTSSADMLEGGAAGTVNMRSARPFDHPGRHFAFGSQGTLNQNAGPWGNHEYAIASDTFGNDFGVLVGGVLSNNQVATPGFETIGWSPPTLSTAQCGNEASCNGTKGSGFSVPATVPAGTGAGLTAGTPIDEAFLLANNPGASIEQINNGILPRLGRPSYESGAEKTYNAIVSLEYRPSDDLHFYMDNMFGKEHNTLTREDMDWVVRANGNMIPLDEKFSSGSCAAGCTVTSGTFANSQFFLEYRPYFEDTDLWGTNPGLDWRVNDWLSGDVQANYTKSTFHREVPSVLVATANNLVVDYTNNGGIPDISSNVDLNDPASFGWAGGRVNMQDERRETATKGLRFDVTLGKGGAFNVKTGLAYDDTWRHIYGYDNSQAWQNAVCGDNPSLFLTSPNTQPPCLGASTATPGAGYPSYPALGVGGSAGMAGPLVYQGSLIPGSALGNYLAPGPAGFITVNWNQFKAASDYDAFHASEPAATGTNTGASGGYIRNSDTGLYVELTGDTKIEGHGLRYNAGVRWVRTLQYIGGPESLSDPRNAGIPGSSACPTGGSGKAAPQCDGSFYPNVITSPTLESNYNDTLPSLELVYDILPNFLARFAASKTMTRPNPASMLPGVSFGDPSAANGTVGNSALQPYISHNLDFGLEYYTGRQGYLAVAVFRKKITGFTANANTTYPFAYLAQYGVNYATLTPTQQAAIDARGGPSAATVVLTQQVNATGVLTVNGQEVDWTQPFDFLLGRFGLDGFGLSANYTHIHQTGTGAAPAIATGVPPDTYNLTLYYEHGPWSVRMAENYNAANVASGLNQSGVPEAAIYNSSYREWDLSSYADIGKLLHWPLSFQITANAINLFDAKQRSYFEFSDATFTEYNPGRELMIGFRARF